MFNLIGRVNQASRKGLPTAALQYFDLGSGLTRTHVCRVLVSTVRTDTSPKSSDQHHSFVGRPHSHSRFVNIELDDAQVLALTASGCSGLRWSRLIIKV